MSSRTNIVVGLFLSTQKKDALIKLGDVVVVAVKKRIEHFNAVGDEMMMLFEQRESDKTSLRYMHFCTNVLEQFPPTREISNHFPKT